MADLGVPRFIPEPGVDSGNDAAAIAEAATGLAQVASDAIVSREKADLRDALGETASAGLEAVTTEEQETEELGRVFTDTGQQELYDNLRRLQRQINQTSGSVKAAVINRAKRLTTMAMRDNPSIRDDLVNEFRQFVSLNPDLDALDLADQQFASDAALAQKQRDAIFNNAYGDVKDGGLGIDPSVPFGSPQFIKMYTDAAAKETVTNQNTLLLNMLESQDNVDIRELGPAIQEALGGAQNAVDAFFKQDLAETADVREAAYRVALGKGTAQDDAKLTAWSMEGGIRQEKVQKYNIYINELELMKTRIPIAQRDTDQGKETLATIDNTISYLQRQRDAVDSMATQPGLSELMEMESAIRTNQWNRDNPRARRIVEDIGRMDKALEHADVLGLDDVFFRDDLGNLLIPELRDTLINSYLFGGQHLAETPQSPEDIRRTLHRAVNTARDPYEAVDNADRGKKALEDLTGINGRIAKVYDLYDNIGEADRAPVYGMFGAATNHLYELRNGNQYADSTVDMLATQYSHPSMIETVRAIRQADTVPNEAAVIGALGEELTDYVVEMPNGGMNGRINRYQARLMEQYGGKPLSHWLILDPEGIQDGKVRYTVRPEAASRVAQYNADRRPGSRFTGVGVTDSDRARVQRRLDSEAAFLSKHVSADLGMVTSADFYKDTEATDPLYSVSWENYGFSRLEPTVGDPNAEPAVQ